RCSATGSTSTSSPSPRSNAAPAPATGRCSGSEEADREVAEIELRVDSLLVDRRERRVDRVLEVGRAFRHGDRHPFAEEARLEERPAGEGAAAGGAGALQQEGKLQAVAEERIGGPALQRVASLFGGIEELPPDLRE